MSLIFSLLGLAGGLGLFLFGMQLCSEGLQKLAARRLKQWVKVLTGNPLLAVAIGALTAIGLQSSSATSALVVGFVSANLMTLSQALGVLLGSALGASLTAQLIAFKITDLALLLIFCGAVLYIFGKRSRRRSLGQTVLGFGMLFYGMYMMTSAMTPIRDYPLVVQGLVKLESLPVLEFLVAMALTAVIQSSPAFLAMLISLATHGLVGPEAVVPFVLGAHLGGTVTGVISSFGTPGRDAKRAALANFGFKFLCGLVFLPLYRPLTAWLIGTDPEMGRVIANTHTFFSLVMAVSFLPFTKPIAELMRRIVPDRSSVPGEALFLDESLLELPELAVDQAQRQTEEMGRIVSEEMLGKMLPLLRLGNDELLDGVNRMELAVDELYKKISRYLTKLGNKSLSDELLERSMKTLYVANDLEHVGDIMIIVVKQAQKIKTEAIEFSEEGRSELQDMYLQVSEDFRSALKAFAMGDQALATKVVREHPRVLRLEKELRFSHFERMQGGNPKTAATSSIHLELVEALARVDNHALNIAHVVLGIV